MTATDRIPRAPWTVPLEQGPVSPLVDRTAAAVVAVAVGTVVVLLANVHPDSRGHGTHEQLGLEPCGWPKAFGMPCPTCGVTTASCHLVHGHVWTAIVTQPFGTVFMGTSILLGAHAVYCLVRRRSFADLLVRLPVWRLLFGGLLLLLASWGYLCIGFRP